MAVSRLRVATGKMGSFSSRRTSARLGLALSVLGVLAPFVQGVAHAQKPPPANAAKPKSLGESLTGNAKSDYEAGRVLANDGDFGGASIKFQAAFDASKDPRLLWNIAACEKQQRHYARAIELLKRFSDDATGVVSAKEKGEATELVKTLQPFTVSVTFEVDEPGATVEVDGRTVGTSPLREPLVLDLGPHKVRATKEGFRESLVETVVGGSDRQTIAMKLTREVHEGKLSLVVPKGASIMIDGKAVPPSANGEAVEVVLTSGGHTLRVTAPRMRAYEREILVKDKETRAVEVALEPEAEPERPKLRVAVGCVDPDPRGTDDGLAVFLDDSPSAANASGGQRAARGEGAAVEYVEYPVPSGPHDVLVRIPGCESATTRVDVAPGAGADVKGTLRSSSSPLLRGPAGNPDWGRIAVSLWLPRSVGPYQAWSSGVGGSESSFPQYGNAVYELSATGVMVQPGLAFRWWTAQLDVGVAGGSPTLNRGPAAPTAESVAKLTSPTLTWLRVGARGGARFPLHAVALHLGIQGGYEGTFLSGVPPEVDRSTWKGSAAYLGAYAMIEATPFCDWPFFFGFNGDGVNIRDGWRSGVLSFQVGAAFQPNSRCRLERNVTYGLR